MNQQGYHAEVKIMGIPDRLVEHGTPRELYNEIGLNAQAVAEVLREWMKEMKIVTTQFQ
jgi:1-deoxy-D-xylulose-5-phosphate synthase